ncbi:hypothetical protein [Streptomyces sp. NPDC058656]|uniref:hypothetical protein n=1 Tax=unclassified Streptomyces TaxID=2593676 RepID=UPI00365A6041
MHKNTSARPTAEDIRRAAEAYGPKLGDLVDYDGRTVQFPDGPQTVPGGRGWIRDVFAGDGEIVARVEHEDGSADTPPLEGLRPVVDLTVLTELSVPAEELHGLPRISPAVAPPAQVDRWSVQDREGNEVAEVEATGYDHAVQVAAQDPKVRAAEPGSGGLVYMRRGTVQKSAPAAVEGHSASTYGALKATLKVPQVYAAIRVLKAGRQVLGGFADTGHCVSAGAYLDARQDTGEVILSCEPTHVRPAGSVLRELLDERERAVVGYADLFRTAGWYVQEIRENGQDGRRRLARLIMELPTTLPWRSRVRRTSDGRFGTITDFSGDDRMVIKWDRAVFPDPFHRTTAELMGPAYQVFPAVDHCSGCGEIVRDDDVEDSYTTCCNEGACSGCAAVNGVYTCGTEAPTGTDE